MMGEQYYYDIGEWYQQPMAFWCMPKEPFNSRAHQHCLHGNFVVFDPPQASIGSVPLSSVVMWTLDYGVCIAKFNEDGQSMWESSLLQHYTLAMCTMWYIPNIEKH